MKYSHECKFITLLCHELLCFFLFSIHLYFSLKNLHFVNNLSLFLLSAHVPLLLIFYLFKKLFSFVPRYVNFDWEDSWKDNKEAHIGKLKMFQCFPVSNFPIYIYEMLPTSQSPHIASLRNMHRYYIRSAIIPFHLNHRKTKYEKPPKTKDKSTRKTDKISVP